MTSFSRPDEQATQSEIDRQQSADRNLKGALKTGAKIAGTAATFGAAASTGLGARILPFLSEYIPTDLALKGISKVSPGLGDFLKKGMSKGLSLKDGLDFIKNQINSGKSEGQNAKDSRNIIEQYSPELHQFIDQEIKNGRPAIQAAAIAQNDKKFTGVINKLTKDHKTPWSNIVEGIYGGQGQAPPQGQAPQQKQSQQQGQAEQAAQGVDPQLAQIMNGLRGAMQNLRGG